MVITDPILADLGYVLENDQEIDLLNFYKSFPITCRAKLIHLQGGKAQLLVQPPGSVCLLKEKTTVLLSNRLLEAVKANILNFDILTGIATISHFEYVGSRLGERMVARVEPKEYIDVLLEKDGAILKGRLVDISLSGIGVHIYTPNVRRGEVFEAHLSLPERKINIPVKVLEVTTTPDYFRLSMKFNVNIFDIGVVMRFIAHRRSEIFEEIQDLYNNALKQ